MDPNEVRKEIPEKEIIAVENYKIGVMHGYGNPANLIQIMSKEFKDSGVNIIIFGHSHSPLNNTKAGILFFNPGSPTDRIFSPYNSYGIIEINDKIDARIVRL